MTWLVDAYNVIFSCKLLRASATTEELNRARFELINQVSSWINRQSGSSAIVVFDAKNPPRECPNVFHRDQLTVMFAREFDEADDLIEKLIRKHSTTRQLTVVSSDRRLVNAAKRRKANHLDSETWFNLLIEPLPPKQDESEETESQSRTEEVEIDADQWLEYFNLDQSELDKVSSDLPDPRWVGDIDRGSFKFNPQDFNAGLSPEFDDLFGNDFDSDVIQEMQNIFPKELLEEIETEIEQEEDE